MVGTSIESGMSEQLGLGQVRTGAGPGQLKSSSDKAGPLPSEIQSRSSRADQGHSGVRPEQEHSAGLCTGKRCKKKTFKSQDPRPVPHYEKIRWDQRKARPSSLITARGPTPNADSLDRIP